ncbi:hypothetical protein EB73_22875 [Mycobacterium sp. SWH-M3]|nr:hypothetical protein EB73_22875 [Mycobacterium sp. SWH-M3]
MFSPPRGFGPGASDGWTGTPHPADIAQSQLFDLMLRGEIDELKVLAAKAERMWRRRIDRSGDGDDQPPEGLLRVRGRIAEVERMLVELRRRFPYDGDSLRVI